MQGVAATIDHQPLTTMEDQLCRGPPQIPGCTSSWGSGACRVCPLSVSLLEAVGWWCFNMVWSCPLGTLALEPLGRCGPRTATADVLPGPTWHELQSNLQMPATSAGLGGAQMRPTCESWLAATSARPAATKQEVQDAPRPDAACLRDFGKILSASQDRPFVCKSHRKQLGWAYKLGWVGLRESQGQGKECEPGWWRLRYGIHLIALCREGSSKEQWPLLALLSGRKQSPQALILISDSPCVSSALWATAPAPELRGSESK